MRRITAVLVGCVGAWHLVAGVLSLVGPWAQPSGMPPLTESVVLGLLLLGAAALLWRRRAAAPAA